jgi:putative serine protease PepD
VVVAVDGDVVTSMSELSALVRRRAPGDGVSVTVDRDGRELAVAVTLGSAPS